MPTSNARSSEDEGTSLFSALWRYRALCVVIVVVTVSLAVFMSLPASGRHSGSVVVALKDPRGTLTQGAGVSSSDLPRYTTRRSDFAKSDAVLERAAELAGTDAETLRDRVSVKPDPNTDAIRIVGTANTADKAALYATSTATAYQELSKSALDAQFAAAIQALDDEKAALRATIAAAPTGPEATSAASSLTELNIRRAELAENAAVFGDGIDYVDKAPTESAGTGATLRNGIIGMMFGLFVAGLAAWFLAARRPRADHADQVEQIIDAPFLGEVATARSLRHLSAVLPTAHDGYEIVSTTVSSLVHDGVLLVVSPTPTLGRTETAVQSALAAAHDGRRVLVVDADDRYRNLSDALGLSEKSGLVDILSGRSGARDVTHTLHLGGVSIDGVAVGPSVGDTTSLYQSQTALQFIAQARHDYELTIVDCAPVLGSAAASALARAADRILLVVETGTAQSVLKRAYQQLSLLGVPIVGFVLTARRSSSSEAPAGAR